MLWSSAYARDSYQRVELDQLAPTQAEAGMAEVDKKVQEYIDEAERVAKSEDRSVKDVMKEILSNESNAGVDALIDPDGRVRVTDGHHKLLAVEKAMHKFDIKENSITWKVRVVKSDDFTGKSWESFGKRLDELDIGRLTPAQMAESKRLGESLGERAQRLPTDFAHLKDSPMRSATGRIFDTLGLKGTQFKPDAQFALGEAFADAGFKVKPGEEFTPAEQGRMQKLMFDSPHSSDLQKALLARSLPENRATVSGMLESAQAHYANAKVAAAKGEYDDSFSEADDLPKRKSLSAKTACIMQSLSRLLGNQVLPKVVKLPADPKTIQRLFTNVQKRAMARTDLERTANLLGKIDDGKISDLSRADQKYIKAVRKAALSMRTAYRFFSGDGAVPKSLDKFATQLGQVNDDIEKWKDGRMSKGDVATDAHEVKKILNDNPNLFSHGFFPADGAAFKGEQKARLGQIKKLLGKADRDDLTVDDYHAIRIRVRDFGALFNVVAGDSGNTGLDLTAAMLNNVSYSMGQVKDGLLVGKRADKFKDPGDQITKIDDESRKQLDKFITLMDNSVN